MKQILRVLDVHRLDINLDQIKYVEGYGNYSILHLTDRKPIMLSQTVKKLQAQLSVFIRIHKGYLVNPYFIVPDQRPSPKNLTMALTTGEVLTISRRRVSSLRSLSNLSHHPLETNPSRIDHMRF